MIIMSFKKNSIQVKLMMFFIILSSVLFITVGFLFFRSTKEAINSSKEKEFITLAQETSNKIERYMFERYGDIQVMVNSPLLKNNNVKDVLKLDYINSVRNAYKAYDYILITDNTGNIEVSSGDVNNDNRYKEFMSEVLDGKTYVSNFIYFTDSKSYGVYYAAPIFDEDNRVKGAVVERMNFKAIIDIISNVRLGEKGYAFLADDGGNYISHPFNSISEISKLSNKKYSTFYTQHGNEQYFSSLYALSKYDTQTDNWYVVVEQPVNEAYGVAYKLRTYTIVVLLISIFIVFILVTLMSRNIARPIKNLLKETQIIAEGDIAQNINIESSDEIGSLAESFNAILSNLKGMMQQVLQVSGEAASMEQIRQYAENFTENLKSGIITIDSAGKITSFNQAASYITGYAEEEIIDKTARDLAEASIYPIIDILIEGVEKGISYIKHIVKLKDKNNEEKSIIINTTVQNDSSGKLLGIVGVFRNAEEVKKLEESILRAKNLEALGVLSAGMAHEIRNPLTSIKGYAQYIKSELNEDSELLPDITVIVSEVDRLNNIIDRFLAFARPKELKLEQCSINKIIKHVITLISKDNSNDLIEIIEVYRDAPMLLLDYDQIEQVVFNIVINAIQAMPFGGKLFVETNYKKALEVVEIEISDTGHGISVENQNRIFDPFFTTKDKGVGLGLAICARIVENHKGVIEVISNPNLGTKFVIKLPKFN